MMHIRQIDLNLLAVFDAIMAEKSVSRAADRLGLTQPAASQALKRLRDLVGDELFVRTARGVTPTPRAREIANPIREALDKVREALGETGSFDCSQSERMFSVTMIAGYEAIILPRYLSWLGANAPHVKLKVESSIGTDLADDMEEGRIDIAMGDEEYTGAQFRNELLFEDPFVVIARRDHPKIGEQITLEQYLALNHVALQVPMVTGTVVGTELRRKGVHRKIVHEVPVLTSIPAVVAATDMLATLPRRTSHAIVDTQALRILSPPVPLTPLKVFQVWHARSDGDPGHRWLRGSFREVCQRI